MIWRLRAFAPAGLLLLSACAGIIPHSESPTSFPPAEPPRIATDEPLPPAPATADYRTSPQLEYVVPAEPGANARGVAVERGPELASFGMTADSAARALRAFRISCPSVVVREDASGLTAPNDWVEPCNAASRWNEGRAAEFFAEHFRAVEIGPGEAFATGYYEPEIAASLTRGDGYNYPIYRLPSDIVEAAAPPARTGEASQPPAVTVHQLLEGGETRPYPDRAAITDGALDDKGYEIAWARDPVSLFFLQVQGSGVLRLPDGRAMRVGYAGNNGYGYTSIGALMRERGLLEPGQTTSQGIQAWLRDHPVEAREIMNANRRFIFFRASDAPAPSGSLGRYVTAGATVAVDPKFVPLGAPVWLDVDQDVADGLWVAQDTGGAIRGANRFDTFWGAGERALATAGGMAGRGQAYVLIPVRSAERLFGATSLRSP